MRKIISRHREICAREFDIIQVDILGYITVGTMDNTELKRNLIRQLDETL